MKFSIYFKSRKLFFFSSYILKSFDVGHSAYNSLWYLASNKFKMSLLYVIHRCQYPQALTALKFWPVSLPSFSAVCDFNWMILLLILINNLFCRL